MTMTTPPTPANPYLTPDVRALLHAVVAALNLPHAETVQDYETRTKLLEQRAGDTQVILSALLSSEVLEPGESAETLARWTAEHPVTYTVHVDREQPGGAR